MRKRMNDRCAESRLLSLLDRSELNSKSVRRWGAWFGSKHFFGPLPVGFDHWNNAHIRSHVHTLNFTMYCASAAFNTSTQTRFNVCYTRCTHTPPYVFGLVSICVSMRARVCVCTPWPIVQVSSDFFRCFHEEDNIKRRKTGNRNAFLVYFVTKEPIVLHGKENKRRKERKREREGGRGGKVIKQERSRRTDLKIEHFIHNLSLWRIHLYNYTLT